MGRDQGAGCRSAVAGQLRRRGELPSSRPRRYVRSLLGGLIEAAPVSRCRILMCLVASL
jgi:hypothetical protein